MSMSCPVSGRLVADDIDPRMSMSGRLSMESNGPTMWNYGSVPSNPSYAPDGTLLSAGHGRRSSIYRQQNSTLFSAFEGDDVALSDLPEEDEDSDEDRRRAGAGTQGQARSLLGQRRDGGAEGGRHPAYQDEEAGR